MFNKSSVKLLPLIENTNNRITFYTEFDGEFEVGDKLYIAVNNTGITEYNLLDSIANTGFTNDMIGYELLNKNGNRIVLDIEYDTFPLINFGLTEGTCFIGRVYIKNSVINRGVINGSLIKDTSTQPLSKSNILWKQGILFDTLGSITNINFNTKSSNDKLILKSEINNGVVESYYTRNNNGIGLSIINLSNNVFNLSDCNINAGVFNNCNITGYQNEINGGELYECFIGDNYIINNGRFINCEFNSSVATWNNGKWYSDYTGFTNNTFKPLLWGNGVWELGTFPNTTTWDNGIFKDGIFNGITWRNGEFDNGEVFGTIWENGNFNNGIIHDSTWENGTFNNGVMYDTNWENGTFNNGNIYSTSSPFTWENGTFNNGTMTNITWENGTFNNGVVSGCTWQNGEFNGGQFIAGSVWQNGIWFKGEFENSIWQNGEFNNGIMRNSIWENGVVYYGVFIDMNNFPNYYWDKGIWYNGTMNNVEVSDIEWYNGIVNDCQFGNFGTTKINWYNGSWNSGTFGESFTNPNAEANWYNGKFYFGVFSGTTWESGTFYKGDIASFIKNRFILDKEFKPFNRSGLYVKKNLLQKDRINRRNKRLPKKKRF